MACAWSLSLDFWDWELEIVHGLWDFSLDFKIEIFLWIFKSRFFFGFWNWEGSKKEKGKLFGNRILWNGMYDYIVFLDRKFELRNESLSILSCVGIWRKKDSHGDGGQGGMEMESWKLEV